MYINYIFRYNNIGVIFYRICEFKKAYYCFITSLICNNNIVTTHNNLGCLLSEQDQIKVAVTEFNKGIEIDQNLPRIYKILFRIIL